MVVFRVFITLLALGVSTEGFSASKDSDKVIRFVRSFFDENSVKPSEVSKEIENRDQFLGLLELAKLHFQPKDIWGNRDYVFGYGQLEEGSTILFAWKVTADSSDISLKDLSGIYEDERMASIQDEKDLKRWKKMREIVAGAFIGVRKSEVRFGSLFPARTEQKTGKSSLAGLKLEDQPLIVKFTNKIVRTKDLVADSERVPTR